MNSERTFASRGYDFFADGEPIDPLEELCELEGTVFELQDKIKLLQEHIDWLTELALMQKD